MGKLPREVSYLIDKVTNEDHESVKSSKQIKPGKLYLFAYDPKHKATLEVWDQLPLIIFLQYRNNLLNAINLHFIPYTYRIQFLKKLQTKSGIVKYKDLASAWKSTNIPNAYAYMSYRSYLISHIKSNIKIFEDLDDQLEIVRNILPQFKKKSMGQTYRDINKRLSKQRKKNK